MSGEVVERGGQLVTVLLAGVAIHFAAETVAPQQAVLAGEGPLSMLVLVVLSVGAAATFWWVIVE